MKLKSGSDLEQVNLDIHREIIEGSRAGRRDDQYMLYKLYSRAMFNSCLRMMNNREEAEDLLQEAFADAFRKLDSFRYESTFGAWLKQIVVNKCINAINKRKAELVFFDEMERFDDHEEEPEEVRGIKVDIVKKAMEKLPEGGRMVFSLYLLEGYDHVEISEILGISESTSKTQYMRARMKVKELLTEMGYEQGSS